jgi:hypothetical protein
MSDSPPPLHILLHVPKCAGRTIEVHLAEHTPADAFFMPRHPGRGGISKMPAPKGIRVLSGHHLARSIESRFPGREIRRSVLLRDPLSFQVSYYNFKMMRYLASGGRPYAFPLYYRALQRDPMAHFLLSRWLEVSPARLLVLPVAEKWRLLCEALSGFWFVADYRRCDELIAAVAADLGVPAVAKRVNDEAAWVRTVDWQPLTAADLTDEQRRRIPLDNPLDAALHATWAGARHEAASVQPGPGPAASDFLVHELARPFWEARRRLARGWLIRRRGKTVVATD